MRILKIKKKIQNYNFLCIGAYHEDNILKLKKDCKLFRTNPVYYQTKPGGVSYNIANNLSLFTKKIHFFSLPRSINLRKNFNSKKIKFHNISNKINDSFYTAIINKDGKMILGLASNEAYEKLNKINNHLINRYIKSNTYLILDLCFNEKLTKKIIDYYFNKKIKIMIAGTSLFKIYKIKKSINKIFALCLNEDEIKILANKKTIKESINFVLRKNPKINLVVTRGNKSVIMVKMGLFYKASVPNVKVINENGGGDTFAAMYFLCIIANCDPTTTLSLAISLGCLHVMNYKYKNMKELINKMNIIENKI